MLKSYWNYTQSPLVDQLKHQGVRALDLTVHYDNGKLRVFHLENYDEGSTCNDLTECLWQIQQWSTSHRGHFPVTVWLEIREHPVSHATPEHMLALLHKAITDSFLPNQLFTPASVGEMWRHNWPELQFVRDKTVFVLIDNSQILTTQYAANYATQSMFLNAKPEYFGEPWAAFTQLDLASESSEIKNALDRNMIVATRVCANSIVGDAELCRDRLDRALSIGVHQLLDAFPKEDLLYYSWIKILQYSDMYTPTSDAVGNIDMLPGDGFAKLSDDAINRISWGAKVSYYRLVDGDGQFIYVKTASKYSDTNRAMGWSVDGYAVCNTRNDGTCEQVAPADCDWKKGVFDWLDTMPTGSGNNYDRWFTDRYATVQCQQEGYGGEDPDDAKHPIDHVLCFSLGAACDHKPRTNVTIYKFEPGQFHWQNN